MAESQLDFLTPSPDPLSWKQMLGSEKQAPYFSELMSFVEKSRRSGKIIYPKNSGVFSSIQHTAFEKVKVVILGQDPYHGPNQAHGLCFSVQPKVPFPPSLNNIFKELNDDLGISAPTSGTLTKWADQGVLLLNSVLTVEAGRAASHANMGWEQFTDKVIRKLNDHREGIVFLLWGSYAQKKGEFIARDKHHVLKAPHPSPLSAHRGFFGCRHFSKANAILESQGLDPIDWSLDES